MSEFRGKRVAVDGYGWLHKGAYTCSTDLCLKRPTDKFVTFFLHRLQVLINHGLVPTIVFDGGQLPMKREENESRRSSRKQNYDKAMSLWKVGKQVAAEEYFQRAVHIGPDHAKQVIDALKLKGVHYIVAPYEADSQMAFLAQSGRVDLVITEDSDLLAYSCPEVLFKLDKEGNVQHVSFDELMKSSKFDGFTKPSFTEMCVLAGCDFLQSIPGIGIRLAYECIKEHGCHTNAIKKLEEDSKYNVPDSYMEEFAKALSMFSHQTVWEEEVGLRHLQEGARVRVFRDLGNLTFLGAHYPKERAHEVSSGLLHPHFFTELEGCGEESPNWFDKELAAMLPLPQPEEKKTKRGKKKKKRKRGKKKKKRKKKKDRGTLGLITSVPLSPFPKRGKRIRGREKSNCWN